MTQCPKTLEGKELALSNNVIQMTRSRKIILPLLVCASESKIKRKSRLKMARKSNVFMLQVVLKTALSFGRCLADSSNIPNDVKLMTVLQFKNMPTIHRMYNWLPINYSIIFVLISLTSLVVMRKVQKKIHTNNRLSRQNSIFIKK